MGAVQFRAQSTIHNRSKFVPADTSPLCETVRTSSIEMHYRPIDRALTDFGFWSLPLTHVDLAQRCQCKSCSQLNSEQTYTFTFLNILRFDLVI